MNNKILALFFGCISLLSFSQTNIKVMSYNLMHFPGTLVYDDISGNYIPRTQILKSILEAYQPDILMVCELQNDAGSQVINEALNLIEPVYARANFVLNQSSFDTSLQQSVFYNQQKLNLQFQDVVLTNLRDINHYNFTLNTSQDIVLEVFVAHLKSSTGTDNQQSRLEMVQQFTNFLQNIPTNHYVIIGGDFNLYTATEPAYNGLLDATNAIVLKDPVDAYGNWSSNSSYATIHTQSPLTSNFQFQTSGGSWDGVTGGLDDRFDFILISDNLTTSSDLYYVNDTYHAFGNNGNCYNSYIANPDCSGAYSQQLRNNLQNMSDHLPVVLELATPYTLNVQETEGLSYVTILNSNVVDNELQIEVPVISRHKNLIIYNTLGQKLKTITLNQNQLQINVSELVAGIYYLKVENSKHFQKFIKL